MNVGQTG